MERVGLIGFHPNPVRTGVHLGVHNARKISPVLVILGKKKGNRSRKPLICRPFVYLSRQPCSATPALREMVCATGPRGYCTPVTAATGMVHRNPSPTGHSVGRSAGAA